MAQATAEIGKIPTESPQPAPSAQLKHGTQAARARRITGGSERAAIRGNGEVITLDCGITVYPARTAGGRWRAVWHEDGRREQCEAPTEEKLAAKLEKVKTRLDADAPKMRQPGAALIAHFLDPDRLPVGKRWSRKHTYTQRRLCERFAAPVIGAVACHPLVFVPVICPADPSGLFRVTCPGPVPVPAVDRIRRDAARGHVGAADHRAAVDRRNWGLWPTLNKIRIPKPALKADKQRPDRTDQHERDLPPQVVARTSKQYQLRSISAARRHDVGRRPKRK